MERSLNYRVLGAVIILSFLAAVGAGVLNGPRDDEFAGPRIVSTNGPPP